LNQAEACRPAGFFVSSGPAIPESPLRGKGKDNPTVKKQTKPTIKAHLIRSAFYLLLLIAICAIPFALAQRKATRVSTANPAAKPNAGAIAQLPPGDTSSLEGTVPAQSQPSPNAPQSVIYD